MEGLFSKKNPETYCECGVTYSFDANVLKYLKGFYELEYMWWYIPSKEAGKKEIYIFGVNEVDSKINLGVLVNHWNRNDGYFKYAFLYQLDGGLSVTKAGEYTKREMIGYFSNLLKRAIDASVNAPADDERYYGGAVDAYRSIISFLRRNKVKEE